MYRKFKVIVDGNEVCTIKNGETESLNLAEGFHAVFIKIDWQKSNKVDFELKENEEVFFEIELLRPNGAKY